MIQRYREIKFRVWNKIEEKMVYYDKDCSSPDMTLNGVLIAHQDQSNVSYIYELMQYTGLKDKNGVEIYKNDCFKRNGHIGRVDQADSGLWIIVFDDGKIIALLSDTEYDWHCEDNEIIGNVHQKSTRTQSYWKNNNGCP